MTTTISQNNPWLYLGRHRADVDPVTRLPHHRFMPRHCAGTSCVHDHPGEMPRPVFRSVLGGAA